MPGILLITPDGPAPLCNSHPAKEKCHAVRRTGHRQAEERYRVEPQLLGLLHERELILDGQTETPVAELHVS
jgi:hypothetical protein